MEKYEIISNYYVQWRGKDFGPVWGAVA